MMAETVQLESPSPGAGWSDSEAPSERWAPLGAVADSPTPTATEDHKPRFSLVLV